MTPFFQREWWALKAGDTKNQLVSKYAYTSGGRGEALTLTWYTYMYLPFRVLFWKIWYTDGVPVETKEPKSKNLVYFEQITVKNTKFCRNWVLFFQKCYTDGWVIRQKIGMAKVRFLRFSRLIYVPPPYTPGPGGYFYKDLHHNVLTLSPMSNFLTTYSLCM